MAFTNYKTWSVGDVLTAADMNTYVRDNGLYLARTVGETTLAASSQTCHVTISSFTNARHLRIHAMAVHATTTNVNVGFRFNSDASALYAWQQDYSVNATPAGFALTGQTSSVVSIIGNESASRFTTATVTVFDYTGSTVKNYVGNFLAPRDGTTTLMRSGTCSGFWSATAAIVSVTLITSNGTMGTGSKMTVEAVQSYA